MKRFETSLGWKFYLSLLIISVVCAFLRIMDEIFDGIGFFIIKFAKIAVEIFAMGILPAVLLAWLTDVANLKRQRENFSNYLKENKSELEQRCRDLTNGVLECINTPDYNEGGEKKTFVQWFNYLLELEEKATCKERIECFLDYVEEVRNTAIKVKAIVEGYHDFYDLNEQEQEKQKIQSLIDACNRIRIRIGVKGNISIEYHPKELEKAVIGVFPKLENDYREPYNSEMHSNEGEDNE